MDEVLGIILYNRSAILSAQDIVLLIPYEDYCVENVLVGVELNRTLRFGFNPELEIFKKFNDNRIKEAALYFPCKCNIYCSYL